MSVYRTKCEVFVKAVLALLVLLSGIAEANEWTWQDTTLQAAYASTLVVDYVQTVQIARDGREANPIMGASGEKVSPSVYFPVMFVAHTAAMYFSPPGYRRVVQGLSIGVSFLNVSRNYSFGYGLSF